MAFRRSKLTSGLVASFYFLSQVALGYTTETNLWAERRLQMSAPASGWAPLVKQLSDSFSKPAVALTQSTGGATKLQAIVSLAQPFGEVREVHLAASADAPMVIHVQDVHDLKEAQLNIGQMILAFQKSGLSLVGVEGAYDAFQVDRYRAFPRKDVTREISELFVDEKLVGGPEYAALVAPEPLRLQGIEDKSAYLANIDAYKNSVPGQAAIALQFDAARAALGALKKAHFTPALLEFDNRRAAYRDGRDTIGAYLTFLVGQLPLDGRAFPHLSRLVDALRLERNMDFPAIERERTQLAAHLATKLSVRELGAIAEAAIAVRAQRITQAKFYAVIADICARNGIPLASYPRLVAYMDYTRLAQDVDPERVLEEFPGYESRVEARLTVTDVQRRVCRLDADAALMGELLRHEMSPQRWSEYQDASIALRRRVAALEADFPEDNVRSLSQALRTVVAGLTPYEDFCRRAVERNDKFVERLLEAMRREKAPTAVLVAGGFHSSGLSRLFRQRGLSYVVVSPRITRTDGQGNYLDVLARDPLPVERLFLGEKINLVSPRVLANPESLRSRMAAGQFLALHEAVGLAEKVFGPDGASFDRSAAQRAVEGNSRAFPDLPGVTAASVDVLDVQPGASLALAFDLTQFGRHERFGLSVSQPGQPASPRLGRSVFETTLTIQGRPSVVRFQEAPAPGLAADILAPIKALNRFRVGAARWIYYGLVSGWEEGLFRVGGLFLANLIVFKSALPQAAQLAALSGAGLAAWIGLLVLFGVVLFVAFHILVVAATATTDRRGAVVDYLRSLVGWRSPVIQGVIATAVVALGFSFNALLPAVVAVLVFHYVWDLTTAPGVAVVQSPPTPTEEALDNPPGATRLGLGSTGLIPTRSGQRELYDQPAPAAVDPKVPVARFISRLKAGDAIRINHSQNVIFLAASIDGDKAFILYRNENPRSPVTVAYVADTYTIQRGVSEQGGLSVYSSPSRVDRVSPASPVDLDATTSANAAQIRQLLESLPDIKEPKQIERYMALITASPREEVLPALTDWLRQARRLGFQETFALTALRRYAEINGIRSADLKDTLLEPLANLAATVTSPEATPALSQVADSIVWLTDTAEDGAPILARAGLPTGALVDLLVRMWARHVYGRTGYEAFATRLGTDPDTARAVIARSAEDQSDVGFRREEGLSLPPAIADAIGQALTDDKLGAPGSLAWRQAVDILLAAPVGNSDLLRRFLKSEPDVERRRAIAGTIDRALTRIRGDEVLRSLYGDTHAAELDELGRMINLSHFEGQGLHDSELITADGLVDVVRNLREMKALFSDKEFNRIVSSWDSLGHVRKIALVGRRQPKPVAVDGLNFSFPVAGQAPSGSQILDEGVAFVTRPTAGNPADLDLLRRHDDKLNELLDANFDALELIDKREMTGGDAQKIIRFVRRMVDAYKVFAPQKAAIYEAKFLEILRDIEGPIAAVGNDGRLPADLRSRVATIETAGANFAAVQNVKNLHSLLRWMHETSDDDFVAEMPNVDATRTRIIYSSVRLNVISIDGAPLIENDRILPPALLTLLEAFRLTNDKPDVRVFLRGNTLRGRVQLGFHRAEFKLTLADPDEGGGLWLKFFESGETVGLERIPYMNAAFQKIGMQTEVGDHTLRATFNKNFGATNLRQLEDVAVLMVRVLYNTRDLDASLMKLSGYLGDGSATEGETVEDVVKNIVGTLTNEGAIPFDYQLTPPEVPQIGERWDPFVGYSPEAFFKNYRAYVKMSQQRARRLVPQINAKLRELGLPLMPAYGGPRRGAGSFWLGPGQRDIDRYLNRPIADGLARGEFVLDAQGNVRRAESNQNLPQLAQAAVADEAEAIRSADVLDGLNVNVRGMTLLGRVGALPAFQDVLPLASGESILVNALVDPETGAILFARGVLIGLDRQAQPLTADQLRQRLGGVESNERPSTEAARVRSRRLLRMPADADAGRARGVSGLVVSSGDGRLSFGRVTLKGDADAESPDPSGFRVLLARNTEPGDLAAMEQAGIVLATSGGKNSHVGVTSREMGKVSLIMPDAAWRDDGIVLVSPVFQNVTRDSNGLSVTSAARLEPVALRRRDFVVADPATGKLIVIPEDQQAAVERVLTTLARLDAAGETQGLDEFFSWPQGLLTKLGRARRGGREVQEQEIGLVLEWITRYLASRAEAGSPFFVAVADRLNELRPSLTPALNERLTTLGRQLFTTELISLEDLMEGFSSELAAADAPSQTRALVAALDRKLNHAGAIAAALGVDASALAPLQARAGGLRGAADARSAEIVAEARRRVAAAASSDDLELVRQVAATAERAGLAADGAVQALVQKRDRLIGEKKDRIRAEKEIVYKLDQIDEDYSEVTGPKAAALGRLRKIADEIDAGVPNGLAVTTNAFDLFLEENPAIATEVRSLFGQIQAERAKGERASTARLAELGELVRKQLLSGRIAPESRLGQRILSEVRELGLGDTPLAVRSSAVQEDTQAAAYAGAAESYLFVRADNLLDVVVQTWASFWLPQGVIYRSRQNVDENDIRPAVLIQEMVNNEIGGVTFTSDPDSGRAQVVTDAALGLTEGVVKGESRIVQFVSDAVSFDEVKKPVTGRARSAPKKVVRNPDANGTVSVPLSLAERAQKYPLTRIQARDIARKARELRARFVKDLDIEWGIARGRWFLFQARSMTTGRATADLLEPFVKHTALGRLLTRSVAARTLYYLAVGIWESGFLKLGVLLSGPIFFFLHPVLAWLAASARTGFTWAGLRGEVAGEFSAARNNFFGSRFFVVIVLNGLYFGGTWITGSELVGLGGAALFHFLWDLSSSPFRRSVAGANAAGALLPPVARLGAAVNPGSLAATSLTRADIRDIWDDALATESRQELGAVVADRNAVMPLGPANDALLRGIETMSRRLGGKKIDIVVSQEDAPGYEAVTHLGNVRIVVSTQKGVPIVSNDGVVDVRAFRSALLADPVLRGDLARPAGPGSRVVVLPPGYDLPVTEDAAVLIRDLGLDWVRLETWLLGVPLTPIKIDDIMKAALLVAKNA